MTVRTDDIYWDRQGQKATASVYDSENRRARAVSILGVELWNTSPCCVYTGCWALEHEPVLCLYWVLSFGILARVYTGCWALEHEPLPILAVELWNTSPYLYILAFELWNTSPCLYWVLSFGTRARVYTGCWALDTSPCLYWLLSFGTLARVNTGCWTKEHNPAISLLSNTTPLCAPLILVLMVTRISSWAWLNVLLVFHDSDYYFLNYCYKFKIIEHCFSAMGPVDWPYHIYHTYIYIFMYLYHIYHAYLYHTTQY